MIITQTMRIKYDCEVHGQRMQDQLKKLETILLNHFNSSIKNRSKSLERAMIKSNIIEIDKRNIYLYISGAAKTVQEYKGLINNKQPLDQLKPPIDLIVYCSSFMQNVDLIKYKSMIQSYYKKYTLPIDTDISNQAVINYKNGVQISFQSEKQYIFQFCNKHGISLDVINQVGHNYKYDATSYDR